MGIESNFCIRCDRPYSYLYEELCCSCRKDLETIPCNCHRKKYYKDQLYECPVCGKMWSKINGRFIEIDLDEIDEPILEV